MTRYQQKLFEKEYSELFGEQVIPIKTLFESKTDDILLDELLENVSSTLYQEIISNEYSKSESLIERMGLSVLDYNVSIYGEPEFDEHDINVYFYSDYHILEYREMSIKSHRDVKNILLMIMHIGNQYDQLYKTNTDVAMHLDEYRLLDGFDKNIGIDIKTSNAGKETVN